MDRNITAQELYNAFYLEACARSRAKGQDLPDEVEVFQILVKETRKAISEGEAPRDFLEELAEVKPHIAIEREQAKREGEREKGLREGNLLDLDDLLK